MPCQGPDFAHSDRQAIMLTETILTVLKNHKITRPNPDALFGKRLQNQWDEGIVDLEAALKKLFGVNAMENF